MIVAKCPLRIGLVGGSSDLQTYIDVHGAGAVINFSVNLYTYAMLSKDVRGFNTIENRYIVGYSQREEAGSISEIKNDVVREVFNRFNPPPCTTMLTTDVYSSGSGLASSSSYMISLVAAVRELQRDPATQYRMCYEAMFLERVFNPLLGWQDTFGCGLPGLKHLQFYKGLPPKLENLNTEIFDNLEIYLYPTGVSRSSTKVLKTIKVPPTTELIGLVNDMSSAIRKEDISAFSKIMKEGWEMKKASSKMILENAKVKSIDEELTATPSVLCHKLCGAGNGGFFLFFKHKGEQMKIPDEAIKVDIDYSGVRAVRL
jgi:D-glycero-alpha-D-manno-heptose-7-phosphate kinase